MRTIALHLGAALLAGSAIGLERTYSGRPAGFRTHALVCLASSVLMMVATQGQRWLPFGETVRVDPTRMAQGIMTGIGFLGAGVICRAGLSVHGLTTAAPIWITAAIGILAGVGPWLPGAAATVVTLGVLAGFCLVESRDPTTRYASFTVQFDRGAAWPESRLLEVLAETGLDHSDPSYRTSDDGRIFASGVTLRTNRAGAFARLAQRLSTVPEVRSFDIAPY